MTASHQLAAERRDLSTRLDARCRQRFGLGIGQVRVSNPNFLSEELARHTAALESDAAQGARPARTEGEAR